MHSTSPLRCHGIRPVFYEPSVSPKTKLYEMYSLFKKIKITTNKEIMGEAGFSRQCQQVFEYSPAVKLLCFHLRYQLKWENRTKLGGLSGRVCCLSSWPCFLSSVVKWCLFWTSARFSMAVLPLLCFALFSLHIVPMLICPRHFTLWSEALRCALVLWWSLLLLR